MGENDTWKVFQDKLVSPIAGKFQYFIKIVGNKCSIWKICKLVLFKLVSFQF